MFASADLHYMESYLTFMWIRGGIWDVYLVCTTTTGRSISFKYRANSLQDESGHALLTASYVPLQTFRSINVQAQTFPSCGKPMKRGLSNEKPHDNATTQELEFTP